MELYQKLPNGRYKLFVEPPPKVVEYTDAQCVTLAGALGVVLLTTFERNMPAHKLVARKIKAVEDAILDLYRSSGAELDEPIAELVFKTWDKTMSELSA